MNDGQTLLKALLRARHLQEHRVFCRAYKKAARFVDPALENGQPSKATFYRWLAGDLARLPHPSHCLVLEAMFAGVTAAELFEQWDERRPLPDLAGTQAARLAGQSTESSRPGTYSDLTAAYASRAEFAEHMPPHTLFDQASRIQAAGLSLNLLCQQYSDHRLRTTLAGGAELQALFLDPNGQAIRAREIEENHGTGDLSSLTRINIQILARMRDELPIEERSRVELRTYDQPVRFNITIVDRRQCVAQPYLPAARGVDSPTFVMRRRGDGTGMFGTFERVFEAMWSSGQACA